MTLSFSAQHNYDGLVSPDLNCVVRRARRPVLLAFCVALLSTLIVLVAGPPALAHDSLVQSTPEAGSTVDALGESIELAFSGAISRTEGAVVITVEDDAGQDLTDGAPTVADNIVTQPVTGDVSGKVTVTWRVISSDGHPADDRYSFTVTPPEPTPRASPSAIPAPAPDASGTAAPNSESATTTAPLSAVTPSISASTSTSATPEPDSADASTVWAWILISFAALLVLAVSYLVYSRSRREKAAQRLRESAANSDQSPEIDR